MIQASLYGSVMISAILLARMLFLKRVPKYCFKFLWILAAFRLVIPCFYTFEIVVDGAGTRHTNYAVFDFQNIAKDGIGASKDVAAAGFGLETAVVFLYILGIFVCVGSMAWAYLRMHMIVRRAVPFAVNDGQGCYNVDVRGGESYDFPFSCGVFRPMIYIPEYMLTFPKSELDMVIAHEKQHIKSGDQLIKLFIAAAVCINWYNPVAWVMFRIANRDIELACDEAVVRSNGEKAGYAMLLIKAAESRNNYAVCSFGAPILKERIECIMESKRITVYGFILAALVLSVMTVFFVRISAVEREDDIKTASQCLDTISDERCAEVTEISEVIDIEEPKDNIALSCPLTEYSAITGNFGEQVSPMGKVFFNTGMNIAAEKGADVLSAASGKVTAVDYNYNEGNLVVIDHGNGCETVYYHLGEVFCKIGDDVVSGCRIGSVGSTGMATGPNLGFAIIKDGIYISPSDLFN